jgi:hypothetical protein
MANVKLSKHELELVTNAELILTKNRIIQKVYDLFGELSEVYPELSKDLDPGLLRTSPKIAKGENYLGLPWVMLDYPRNFSQTDVFAIRSFFWWGKFFSITLQLQGRYQQQFASTIQQLDSGWLLCIGSDAWQHHFEPDNYAPFYQGQDLQQLPFIKLAKKIPLQEWDNAFDFFTANFAGLMNMLSAKTMK